LERKIPGRNRSTSPLPKKRNWIGEERKLAGGKEKNIVVLSGFCQLSAEGERVFTGSRRLQERGGGPTPSLIEKKKLKIQARKGLTGKRRSQAKGASPLKRLLKGYGLRKECEALERRRSKLCNSKGVIRTQSRAWGLLY